MSRGWTPGLCPANGSVSPEHVAAVLGWLKVTGENLPEKWLGRFAWHEDKKWFIHPEHRAVVETLASQSRALNPATPANGLRVICR